MRYRPLGATGRTVSAVTLAVGDEPRGAQALIRLVYAALEAGVNAFELRTADPDVAHSLGKALLAVERDMAVVSLRLPWNGGGGRETIVGPVEVALLASRLGHLDLLILDDWPQLDIELLQALAAAKASERVTTVGASGEAFDRARHRPEIDALVCAYTLRAGWPERNRIRNAVERGKFVIGQDSYPDLGVTPASAGAPAPPVSRGLFGFSKKPPPIEKTGGYEFMRRTPGWEPDEICLAYALTEPALASILIEAVTPEEIDRLAAVAERELPTGMPAQIEMARFAAQG